MIITKSFLQINSHQIIERDNKKKSVFSMNNQLPELYESQ